MSNDEEILIKDPEVVEFSGAVFQSFYQDFPTESNVNIQSKRGRANNVVSSFCDANVTGSNSTQVYADIVGRNVVGQKTMNMKACVPIHRKDNN